MDGADGTDGGGGTDAGGTDAGASDACVPTMETCDGTDQDCDGTIDEGFMLGTACDGPDSDMCAAGGLVCDPAGPRARVGAYAAGGGLALCTGPSSAVRRRASGLGGGRAAGLDPPRMAPRAPKARASTSSATPASMAVRPFIT